MPSRVAALRALLPWPDVPARAPEPDPGEVTHPERARVYERLRGRLLAPTSARQAGVLLDPAIPGRPDLAVFVDGVPLAVALERPTVDHAAAQLSLRAAPTTVLLVALGADGTRLGTPARDFQFNPAAWPLVPDLHAAADALHPRWLLERLSLTANVRDGLLLPVAPADVAASAAARSAWQANEDVTLPMASTLVLVLGLHRMGASPLVLAASPARAAELAGKLDTLSVPAVCAETGDQLDASSTGVVRVSTAATAARATRKGHGAVLIEGADRRERRLRERGWGPFLRLTATD